MDWMASQVVMDNWSLTSAIHYCSRRLSNYTKGPIATRQPLYKSIPLYALTFLLLGIPQWLSCTPLT